jgi:hypothetical protein
MEDQMQTSRFERKYMLTEKQAALVREFLKCRMVLDDFSVGKVDGNYPVHSLYLDSDRLHTYWATIQMEKTRFKLRVRYYDDNPKSPVFFEVKRRVNECILKQRGVVKRSSAPGILSGQFPTMDDLVSPNPKHLAAVQNFCHLMLKLHAVPKIHIAYEREAWLSPGNNTLRITFDKYVRGEERFEPKFVTQMEHPVYPFGKFWVLELKYTNRFPTWLTDLMCQMNLQQTGAAKYCGSIINILDDSMRAHYFQDGGFASTQFAKYV